ncbi:GDP-mannose-dependent alpha-(1-6)-phosphatidylinositol dimannoside mannosyltransferase [Virgisporangium aliadipatigenens]|uniref:GDP-mannose-dependent alpha-(1-6)-phosphatidylinositol dimannoside mannosyltransferase n=1 Tax=Virgisporangium aliadipatigenens TaxID=741659 RepID=A0A8J4DWD5_9ACTN|nr:GDP-mannose-dependent alpha-(1-6)-phosphatidylinositol dimannoside mannosyltransferase [Virgisporangium aliadipatigenens]
MRLANFVTARSGGLRTALRELGEGYTAAGHDTVLIVPGDSYTDEVSAQGRVITLPGPVVPFTGGYRVLLRKRPVRRLLEELAPDRLEVSDRFTLRWTGRWARERAIPSVMVSHESLAGLLGAIGMSRLADPLNARSAASYDTVLCTTAWAGREFARLGAENLVRVPLGVDLEVFHPRRRDPDLRLRYASPDTVLLVHCGRLSSEKRPDRSIEALRALRAEGVPAVLVVAGDGPLRDRLERDAGDLPVRFERFIPDRHHVAALLATADVVLAPGPIETFGLAALEALASGSPVVVDRTSALPEVIGDAGVATDGADLASGVRELLARPEAARRAAARARAERYGWPAAVEGFLTVHGATVGLRALGRSI